jgi:outer membrane lipoprotein SlyB
VATVLGAVGGGVAGNEVEKRSRATTVYQVRVRMDDGTVRTVTQATAPTVGQNVTVEGSSLRARASTS